MLIIYVGNNKMKTKRRKKNKHNSTVAILIMM